MTDPVDPDSAPAGEPAPVAFGPPPRVGAGDTAAIPTPPDEPDSGPDSGSGSSQTPPLADPIDDQFDDEFDDEFEFADDRRRGIERRLRTLLEWVAVAVGALAVALLIKAFLLQAFYIPSSSMEPTLSKDDRVLVNKLSYRFGDIGRGDIIVFEKPPGATGDINDLIKRVIVLPGETITLVDGDVFVDGNRLDESYVDPEIGTQPLNAIPNCDNEPVNDRCTVPDGMVFVMGDNRSGSTDSRRFGPIPEGSVVGRAFLKVWPLGDAGFL